MPFTPKPRVPNTRLARFGEYINLIVSAKEKNPLHCPDRTLLPLHERVCRLPNVHKINLNPMPVQRHSVLPSTAERTLAHSKEKQLGK